MRVSSMHTRSNIVRCPVEIYAHALIALHMLAAAERMSRSLCAVNALKTRRADEQRASAK